MATTFQTREQYLVQAASELHCITHHPKIAVSVGFPKGSRGKATAHAIGQCCWGVEKEGIPHIFISPVLADPLHPTGVLATLVHELIHASVGHDAGHKTPFKRLAEKCGLLAPMTATSAGDDLLVRLTDLSKELGPYPHQALTLGLGIKKQGTRMLKAACPQCGYTVRLAKKWADEALPTCSICKVSFEMEEPAP